MAYSLIGPLRHPRVICLIVAPECFYDHEVIVEALILCVRLECGLVIMDHSSFVARPFVA